jgi:hypothetical protein
MTEAVINVLASYYKSTNSIKWTSLFNRDDDFLNALKRSRSWNPRPSQYALNWIDTGGKEIAGLIPWKNDDLGGSILARYKFLEPRGDFQLKNRVQEIARSLEPHNTLMTNFKPEGKWLSQEKPEKWWALILAIGNFYHSFIEEKFVPPNSEEMIKELEAWKFKTEDSNLNLENSHDKSLRKKFRSNVKNLFELIWKINSRLLENLGCEMNEDTFLEEQHDLQIEFFRLLTLSVDPESSKLYSSSPIIENRFEIQQELIKALNFEDERIVYEIERRAHDVSEKQIVITKAAVEVISTYYWKKNPYKWLQVFQDEETLVLNLSQVATRLLKKFYYKQFKDKKFLEIRQLGLLPWKNNFVYLDNQFSIIKREFQYQPSQNIFNKLKAIDL